MRTGEKETNQENVGDTTHEKQNRNEEKQETILHTININQCWSSFFFHIMCNPTTNMFVPVYVCVCVRWVRWVSPPHLRTFGYLVVVWHLPIQRPKKKKILAVCSTHTLCIRSLTLIWIAKRNWRTYTQIYRTEQCMQHILYTHKYYIRAIYTTYYGTRSIHNARNIHEI